VNVTAPTLVPARARNCRRESPASGPLPRVTGSVIAFPWARSVMAGAALRGRARLAVALDAVAHVQRADLVHLTHVLHVAVTGRAGDARLDVREVREACVVGQAVKPLPVDGLLRR